MLGAQYVRFQSGTCILFDKGTQAADPHICQDTGRAGGPDDVGAVWVCLHNEGDNTKE